MAEMIDPIKMGQFIKRLMKQKNLTQDDLAKHLYISKSAVSQNLNGKNVFDIQNLMKLADLFGLSLDDLIAARLPSDHLDVDSEYVRMIKRGLKDFKSYHASALNVAQPDVYGKVLLDYILENDLTDWMIDLVEREVQVALPTHQRYRFLMHQLIMTVYRRNLTSPLPLIQRYVDDLGALDWPSAIEKDAFFTLMNAEKDVLLATQIFTQKNEKVIKKSLFFIPITIKKPTFWIARPLALDTIIQLKLIHLWHLMLNVYFKNQTFYVVETYFKKLVQHNFIEAIKAVIVNIGPLAAHDTFFSTDTMDALLYLLKHQGEDDVLLALDKNFVFHQHAFLNKVIQAQHLDFAQKMLERKQPVWIGKKLIVSLVKSHAFSLIKSNPHLFTQDVLNYALDALELKDASPLILVELAKLGARFDSKYSNGNTFEKVNRLMKAQAEGEKNGTQ